MGSNLQSLQGVNKQTYMKGSKAQFLTMIKKGQGMVSTKQPVKSSKAPAKSGGKKC